MEIRVAERGGIAEPLVLLSGFLRDGEPLSEGFLTEMEDAVGRGDISVVSAFADGRAIGVLVLAVRLSVALGGAFASIEDLYVLPGYRRSGAGRAMISAAEKLCSAKDVSYVEVQIEEGSGGAEGFYSSVGYEREEDIGVMSRSQVLGGSGGSSITS